MGKLLDGLLMGDFDEPGLIVLMGDTQGGHAAHQADFQTAVFKGRIVHDVAQSPFSRFDAAVEKVAGPGNQHQPGGQNPPAQVVDSLEQNHGQNQPGDEGDMEEEHQGDKKDTGVDGAVVFVGGFHVRMTVCKVAVFRCRVPAP